MKRRQRARWYTSRRLGFLHIGLLTASLMSTTFGCSRSNVAHVSGTVLRKDGTPVSGAHVIARSDETGKTANGQTDSSGHYELDIQNAGDVASPGDYYVIVIEELGDENTRRSATIAGKYAKSSTSGLKFTARAGENTAFDMSLDPK